MTVLGAIATFAFAFGFVMAYGYLRKAAINFGFEE